MIKFPDGFIQLRYPGYFWHPESRQVFSIKSGVLKSLCLNKLRVTKINGGLYFKKDPNFCISVGGRAIRLSRSLLVSGQYSSSKQEIQIQYGNSHKSTKHNS
jgi:hypothetical protein